MLAISRLDPDADSGTGPVEAARAVLAALAERPGFRRGQLARALEGPGWVLVTEWADVGSYRRGLSGYDVKLAFAGLMPAMVNEPSAFDVVEEIGTAASGPPAGE